MFKSCEGKSENCNHFLRDWCHWETKPKEKQISVIHVENEIFPLNSCLLLIIPWIPKPIEVSSHYSWHHLVSLFIVGKTSTKSWLSFGIRKSIPCCWWPKATASNRTNGIIQAKAIICKRKTEMEATWRNGKKPQSKKV